MVGVMVAVGFGGWFGGQVMVMLAGAGGGEITSLGVYD